MIKYLDKLTRNVLEDISFHKVLWVCWGSFILCIVSFIFCKKNEIYVTDSIVLLIAGTVNLMLVIGRINQSPIVSIFYDNLPGNIIYTFILQCNFLGVITYIIASIIFYSLNGFTFEGTVQVCNYFLACIIMAVYLRCCYVK